MICTEPPAFAALHVASAPAEGFVVVRMLPVMLPTAQSTVETQEAPSKSPEPAGVATDVQAETPPVGSVEAKSRPPRAAATQSDGVPQEMLRKSSWDPSCVVCHCPAVGFVEVRTRPPLELFDPPETAAQKDGEGQDTLERWVAPCPPGSFTTVGDQAAAPRRFGRGVDEAFMGDRDTEGLRGARDRLQPAAQRRAVRFPFRRR